MKKYKIGDISKMLNIPIQTIRFYEEHGIVRPQKDAETGYRYYDAWDVNNLIDCLHLRGLDFTLNQTEKMINTKDLQEICDQYMEQEKLILSKLEHYNIVLDALSKQRQQIQHFQSNSGKTREGRNPALIYHRYRNRGSFESISGSRIPDELMKEMNEWMNLIPEVTPTFMIQFESFIESDMRKAQFWWGWSLPVHKAMQKGIEPTFPNEYLPPNDSIYTVFEAEVRSDFSRLFMIRCSVR